MNLVSMFCLAIICISNSMFLIITVDSASANGVDVPNTIMDPCEIKSEIADVQRVSTSISSDTSTPIRVLVGDNRANAVIVLTSDVPDSVRLAASEFQNYISQITGVTIPIQGEPSSDKDIINIFIGQSQYTKNLDIHVDNLRSDGFRIVSKSNWLVIVGRDYVGPIIKGEVNPWQYHETYSPKWKISAFGETGTLYGVYNFLQEYCGIRWYMPSQLGTVVPKADSLKVGVLNITKEPDFEYRYPWLCNFSETDDEPIWYRRVGFGAVAPVPIMHSFGEMLKYKDAHPEYFALIDGQRDFTNLSTAFPVGNLCLSNSGLLEQWIDDICKYFDAHPEQQVYSVAPNDGMYRICECSECQSQINLHAEENGKFSNYVWTFIDKVARGVAKKHPSKYIGCFAYEWFKAPPSSIEKLSPNVAVMICKSRASYYNQEKWKKNNRQITEWRKKAEVLYIWEYYLQSWLPWRDLPIPFPHIISDDLKSLKGLSRGEFIEAESWQDDGLPNKMNFPGMQHLNLYVTARMYWDTTLDVNTLLDEYFRLFYGPAEQEMKTFWLTAESYWMNQDKSEKVIGFGGGDPMKIYTKKRLEILMAYINSAKSKTVPQSVYRKRIDLIGGEFERAVQKLTSERVVNIPHIIVGSTDGGAIVLDGKIDDLPWKAVKPITFVDEGGNDANFESNAYVTWDNDYLYFAFENLEPEMAKVCAEATKRDQSVGPALWDEDGIEIFICPDPNNINICYQFIINAKGIIWDASLQPNDVDKKWNSGIETFSSIRSDKWVLEAKIPFKDMGISVPIDGKTIAINMYRNRKCGGHLTYSCWSPTLDSNHMTPSRFGKMIFERR